MGRRTARFGTIPGERHFVIRLVDLGVRREADRPAEQLASVFARTMPEAIALAMQRYPGYAAVDGERH